VRRVDLTIDRLSKSGDGVAQLDGRAVFVAGALPGERVSAEVTERSRSLHGELVEVLERSPARRAPSCPLATTCGGCDWLHVAEAVQLEQKQGIVTSTLEHVGGLSADRYELLPTVSSPSAMGYRRRAVLHPAQGKLGFFGRGSHVRVPVDRCPALTPSLEALPGRIAGLLAGALKDVEEVHLLECEGRVSISVHLTGQAKAKHREVMALLLRDGQLDGAALVPEQGKGGTETFGKPVLEEDGVLYRPDGFAQANAEVNRALVRQAIELLDPSSAASVLELYSGNGNFTFKLASRSAQVLAVETSSISVQLAQDAARKHAVTNVRFVQGDCVKLADSLVREGKRFERVLLDPPRTGAEGVGRWAAKLLATRVVYVACDPASLARDAAELVREGYSPIALQLFDLFPQTHHIEAVMAFGR
jgi:23S rRNA (uracil1939-C5)-methyltransferase